MEQVELTDYNKDILAAAIEAIQLHIISIGGQVENTGEKFDPYKSTISSTTGEQPMKVP